MDVLGQQYLVKMFLRPHVWLLGAKHFQTVRSQGILDPLLPAEEVRQTHSSRLQQMKMLLNVKRVGGISMEPTSVVLEAQVYKYWEGNSTGKGGQKQWDQKCLRLHMLQTVQIE